VQGGDPGHWVTSPGAQGTTLGHSGPSDYNHQQQQQWVQAVGPRPDYNATGVAGQGLQLGGGFGQDQESAGFSRISPGSPRLLSPGAERLIEAAKLLRQQEVSGMTQVGLANTNSSRC
jgi:hypothetical protein